MYRALRLSLLIPLLGTAAAAQNPTVEVDQSECIPIGDNGLVYASTANEPPGSSVRVYFRRLNVQVEDFYYVEAFPDGAGRYWAVLPKAEDAVLEQFRLRDELMRDAGPEEAWAAWWQEKERSEHRDPNNDLDRTVIEERAQRGKRIPRDWMRGMDNNALQGWLEGLENEPTEYYATIHGSSSELLAQSAVRVVEVRDDCQMQMTDKQASVAENLTVGETAPWAQGERVFHWLCDGIVTRVDPTDLYRSDAVCRACVIAWWQKKEILIPAAAAAGVLTGIVVTGDDNPVSPSQP